jgi:FYVE/RhoGEF/PH domain-containing protein 5/6
VNSLLITPIQRLPRYVLLLDDLLANTPEYHCDHDALRRAVTAIRAVSTHVNESKRDAENFDALLAVHRSLVPPVDQLLQPHRRLMLSGVLFWLKSSDKCKEYTVHLLNDLLVIAAVHEKLLSSGTVVVDVYDDLY